MAEINDYFSDEELAQAKETFKKSDRIHALIRRLEAAEYRASHHNLMFCQCSFCEAWRKACGK